jgi:hypothetical protein
MVRTELDRVVRDCAQSTSCRFGFVQRRHAAGPQDNRKEVLYQAITCTGVRALPWEQRSRENLTGETVQKGVVPMPARTGPILR